MWPPTVSTTSLFPSSGLLCPSSSGRLTQPLLVLPTRSESTSHGVQSFSWPPLGRTPREISAEISAAAAGSGKRPSALLLLQGRGKEEASLGLFLTWGRDGRRRAYLGCFLRLEGRLPRWPSATRRTAGSHQAHRCHWCCYLVRNGGAGLPASVGGSYHSATRRPHALC